ncbi:flagellar basal body-associated FliL family protein [Rhodovulum euryhalinum]|uniref:Flagellar protein FliL n=1 Tax=Rhodovulum euryhalinum TaxID=35805 RepID=A0A4R2KLH7_9RHOB|nr:flagellar basal body-associated FliL family protein [Rhodovulum euryhalinum]TCO73367.1 flagellar basal body-associated protein FliL [Rhodovulum euryhalinum]
MGKLLPVIIAVVGLLVGGAAGFFLRPAPSTDPAAEHGAEQGADTAHDGDAAHGGDAGHADGHDGATDPTRDFVKLNNQFVIPVVRNGRVGSLVVMSLSVEMTGTGGTELVFKHEPKLRDVFLQVMFDHANAGGFDGAFTESGNMTMLRRALVEVAQKVLGPDVRDILITDIVRQDA